MNVLSTRVIPGELIEVSPGEFVEVTSYDGDPIHFEGGSKAPAHYSPELPSDSKNIKYPGSASGRVVNVKGRENGTVVSGFECPVCPFRARSATGFRRHMRAKHGSQFFEY